MKPHVRGWSLVELLVALALLALLMVPVWMILSSARNVSGELSRGLPGTELDAAFRQFEEDLLHTLGNSGGNNVPAFTLDPDDGAAWQRLARDEHGRVLTVEVRWIHDPASGDWLRLENPPGPEPENVVTNRVLGAVTELRLRAGSPDSPQTAWPPDEAVTRPPPWVGVHMRTRKGGEVARDFLVPAALTAPPADEGEDR